MLPTLLVIHVFSAFFWFGGSVFLIRFVAPTVAASGEEGLRFFMRMAETTRFSNALIGSGGLAVLSGAGLLGVVTGGFNPSLLGSSTSLTLLAGGLCALAAWLIAFSRMGKGWARGPLAPIYLGLLGLALLAMVIAPFV